MSKSTEVRNENELCPFNWWLNRTYTCNLRDPSRFSRSLQFAAVPLSHNRYGSYLQVQLHTGRENLFKVIFFWFSRWEMECKGRGVEQASGWQAWKRPGQIMMTINVGNEQRVTSLAGRMRLVLKGRESGVSWAATVGCKDNGSRDINSNEAHVSPNTHKQTPNKWDDPELPTQRTQLATQGLNSITCYRKSYNFSWKLNQTFIKSLAKLSRESVLWLLNLSIFFSYSFWSNWMFLSGLIFQVRHSADKRDF